MRSAQPTTTAATRSTEPEVVAGIASAEGRLPNLRVVSDYSPSRPLLGQAGVLLTALALGAVAGSWLCSSPRRR